MSLLIFSCQSELSMNDNKNSFYDDISDITHLNNLVYTTNYDISGNAGSQIDLMVFDFNEVDYFLKDKFELDLNGQGYLSMTNDGKDIYLQSRSTHLVFKLSSIGELGYAKYDTLVDPQWIPSGIAYNSINDSLIFLYRNSLQNNNYRLRITSKSNISDNSTKDDEFIVNDIDSTHHGVYSLTYANSKLYALAVKNNEDVLLTIDYQTFNVENTEIVGDSTVVGISIFDNSVYLSYRDKRILKFKEF
jgi:hypothetical protein